MSAMSEMSRAIRLTIDAHSVTATLQGVPTDVLKEFVTIVAAFHLDLESELDRREAMIEEPPR